MKEHLTVLKHTLDRRSFLKWMGVLSLGLFAPPAVSVPLTEEKFGKKLYKFQETLPLMGTFVTITALDPSRTRAQEAIGAGFNEIRRLTNIFSRFAPDTAVSALNKRGILRALEPEMRTVLECCFYYHGLTHGDFDITVNPLVDLLRETFAATGQPPALEQLKTALSLVGMERVSYGPGGIKFLKPGMGITLDGIAKGYIVDRVAEMMTGLGIAHALINAGGDIHAVGDRKWRIAIRDPFKSEGYVEAIDLKESAIATSGNYEIYFDRSKLHHHLIDPHTGYSPSKTVSVSIAARTTLEADALSTAVLVGNPVRGKHLIDALAGVEGLIITRNGFTLRSAGWGRCV